LLGRCSTTWAPVYLLTAGVKSGFIEQPQGIFT
jgi:hypothetical protein